MKLSRNYATKLRNSHLCTKTFFLSVLLTLSLNKANSQEVFTKTIKSNYLGETKTITVALPKDYHKTKSHYPMTLILNSGELFYTYLASTKLFCSKDIVPEQIIIGIEKTAGDIKKHRYSYNALNSFPSDESISTLNFIKEELVPAIEASFRTTDYKTIVANDVTANFASYFLFEKNPLFNAYMCLNPNYAKDMPNYLRQYSAEISNKNISYYFSEGNTTNVSTRNLINNADQNLHRVSNTHFKSKHEHFEGTSNLISIPQSIALAQEYVFSSYSPINEKEFKENIAGLSSAEAIDYLLKKYETIKNDFGIEMPIRVEDFIGMEDLILDSPENLNILKFSDLALKYHPQLPLGDFYKGYFFEKNKKYNEALVYYKRGYRKIPYNSENADNFFKNIQRVAGLMNQGDNSNVAENSTPVKFDQIYKLAAKN